MRRMVFFFCVCGGRFLDLFWQNEGLILFKELLASHKVDTSKNKKFVVGKAHLTIFSVQKKRVVPSMWERNSPARLSNHQELLLTRSLLASLILLPRIQYQCGLNTSLSRGDDGKLLVNECSSESHQGRDLRRTQLEHSSVGAGGHLSRNSDLQ